MRHGKRFNHLGRTAPHRKAMLSNMASSLITNKRISTTVAKAKALRKYVEPIITKSKDDTTHSRRTVFSYLQDKDSVRILFDDVAEKIAARPGGYTRIIKTGNRLGDNAEMCIIELVDYNELLLAETSTKKKKTRRRGKKSSDSSSATEAKAEATTEANEAVEEAKVVEEEKPADEVKTSAEEVVEEKPAKKEEGKAEKNVEAKAEQKQEEKKEEPSKEKKEDGDSEKEK